MDSASATLQQFTLLEKIGNWEVVLDAIKKKRCHAVSYPIKRKIYRGNGGASFLVISHMGHNAFSININVSTTLVVKDGLQFIANGKSYSLKVKENFATSYSAAQDIDIINDIIMEDLVLKVRSVGKNGDIVLDYYSVHGLKEALLYMDAHCLAISNYGK